MEDADPQLHFEEYLRFELSVQSRAGILGKALAPLRDIFRRVDREGLERITETGVQEALALAGFVVDTQTLAALMSEVCITPRPFVDVLEYLTIVRRYCDMEVDKILDEFFA